MARGRPDYWYGMTPNKSIYGINQTSWHISEEVDIPAESFVDVCEYTVPEGYILHAGFSSTACNGPGLAKCSWLFAGVETGPAWWDTIKHTNLPDGCVYQVPAGISIALRMYNLDDVEWSFTATIVGFLETRG